MVDSSDKTTCRFKVAALIVDDITGNLPNSSCTVLRCCGSGSGIRIKLKRNDPDPHQSDKLEPDPHEFANYKPKSMEYEPI